MHRRRLERTLASGGIDGDPDGSATCGIPGDALLSGAAECGPAEKRTSPQSGGPKTKRKRDCEIETSLPCEVGGPEKQSKNSLARAPKVKEEIHIVSWNVGSLRKVVRNQDWDHLLMKHPDILRLQETRCPKSQIPQRILHDFPHSYWSMNPKLPNSGVAILSKIQPQNVNFGTATGAYEDRIVTAQFEDLILVNVYSPFSGRDLKNINIRQEWGKDFSNYLASLSKSKKIIICGDLNVAQNNDAHPKLNHPNIPGCSQEERKYFKLLLKDYQDVYKSLNPKTTKYSCWSYQNKNRPANVGWRFDYFLSHKIHRNSVTNCDMYNDIHGSDHCPIYMKLQVPSAQRRTLKAQVKVAPQDMRLGLVVGPTDHFNLTLPETIITQSGVVPITDTTVDIRLMNISATAICLPKQTVIGEVYLLNPYLYDLTMEATNQITAAVNQVRVQNRDTQTGDLQDHGGVLIDTTPKLPPLGPNDPLPVDLKELLDRCEGLSENDKVQVINLLKHHRDIFAEDNVSFGRCPWVKYTIDTGDPPPIKLPARPLPLHYREEVIRQYTKLLKDGTVRPSHSQWASPILCIPKKTGDIRICVDYRALNAVTKVPATPIPRIQDLLEKLAGKRYYLLCDVAFGYHNIEIAEKDIPKTAIILPDNLGLPSRHLEYTRLGFGLAAAPGLFQSVTDRLIAPATEKTIDNDLGESVAVYLDDICIGADTFQELLQRTNALFNRLRAAGFLLKAKKCNLFHTKLAYLGHTISKDGIHTDAVKVEKITHWPTPQNVDELRTWKVSRIISNHTEPSMAEIATPLYNLLHQNKK